MAWSDDGGESFTSGGVVIDVPAAFRHRPYVKYASDGKGTVHLAYTEGHPRDFDNSLYHLFYRDGKLHRSDGSVIRSLAEGLREPAEGTRVFQGDPRNVAWVSDLELDTQGRPFVAYSVQKDSAGLPPGQGGSDHRYRIARWTGKAWEDRELALRGHAALRRRGRLHGRRRARAGRADARLRLDERRPDDAARRS